MPKSPSALPDLARHLDRARPGIAAAWFAQQFNAELFARFPNPFAQEAAEADVVRGHLTPLVNLLAEYARTGQADFRDLYLAERRRYAPHRDGAATLRAYFQTLLPRHEATLAAACPVGGVDDWLRDVHRPLVESRSKKPVRVLTVGDCLLGQIQSFLRARGLEAGIELDFRYYYFSALLGVQILEEGLTSAIRDGVDLIAVSYLSYEGIPLYRSFLESADAGHAAETQALIDGIARFMRGHLHQMRELTDAPILLHNACGLPLARWRRLIPVLPAASAGRVAALARLNAVIADIAGHVENCILVDETAVTARRGLRHCGAAILPRRIARDADMHPAHISRYLADAYVDVIADWHTLRKTKLLLVDFDNTLWSGVMADGAVTHFTDRQVLLKQLAEQGILLAAVSKNDPANIRWDEMALSEHDFVALKINWNLKVQSILELAGELNLGRDSFVLLDDNPAELALVRGELPEVACLDSTRPETWSALRRLFAMPNTRQTDEARRRTQMYKEQVRRDQEVRVTSDYPALMATLSLRAVVGPARGGDLDRLLELVQRTNQFNTTTRRYSRGELESMMASDQHAVIAGELADKFGALGIVAVAIVRKDGGEAVIDNFVMSCRAMGFGMEQVMLGRVLDVYPGAPVVGRFIPSDRNEPASTLYKTAGFAERATGEWLLPAGGAVEVPAWIAVTPRG